MPIPSPTNWPCLCPPPPVQACRGEEFDLPVTGMVAMDSMEEENEVVMEAGVVYTQPAGADFLMCYSVAEGETA